MDDKFTFRNSGELRIGQVQPRELLHIGKIDSAARLNLEESPQRDKATIRITDFIQGDSVRIDVDCGDRYRIAYRDGVMTLEKLDADSDGV